LLHVAKVPASCEESSMSAERQAIKRPKIPREFYQPSTLGTLGLISFMLAMFTIPAAINYYVLIVSDYPLPAQLVIALPLFVLAGQAVHLMGWIGHEGFHLTLHNNRHASTAIGLFFSSMTVLFFQSGMAMDHWTHHRYANTDKDPDLKLLGHYQGFWSRLLLQRARANRLYFKRALALALNRPLAEDLRHINLPFALPVFRRLAIANFALAGLWLIVYLAIDHVLPGMFWILFLVPALFGAWLSGLRSFVEHNHTEAGLLRDSRSRVSPLFTFLEYGGNYHLEHHLYPAVPQWRLPKLHRYLVSQGLYQQLEDPSLLDRTGIRCYRYARSDYVYGSKGPRQIAALGVQNPSHA
jgi:fatty acid desaturase